MSHYLVRLCEPNPTWGGKAVVLEELHRDLPRMAYGWARRMHRQRDLYVFVRVCALPDEDCRRYRHQDVPVPPAQPDAEAGPAVLRRCAIDSRHRAHDGPCAARKEAER